MDSAAMLSPLLIGAIAGLLVIISLIQPLARRLGLAPSVLLAVVGVAIGSAATWLMHTSQTDAFNEIADVFVNLPLDSSGILNLFLPILLFQTTLTLDVRRMAEDGAVVFTMAVVAVLVATAFIGVALAPFSGMSLIACLLLGSIVATTDPVAVVAIFRDIGAPARLARLVEGESLLNDAAAIALFVLLLDALLWDQKPTATDAARLFAWSFAGGIALGYAGAQILVRLLPLVREFRLAQVTLSFALPYLVYVIAEHMAGVSGVVAVVAAGIVINLVGPSRVTPDGWTYLNDVWDQIAFWASSLIFMLASILIPKLLVDVGWADLGLLVIVIVSALVARAVVLFGLLPLMSMMRISQPGQHTVQDGHAVGRNARRHHAHACPRRDRERRHRSPGTALRRRSGHRLRAVHPARLRNDAEAPHQGVRSRPAVAARQGDALPGPGSRADARA